MRDKVLQSYKRWMTQTAREFNVKDDVINDIVKMNLIIKDSIIISAT